MSNLKESTSKIKLFILQTQVKICHFRNESLPEVNRWLCSKLFLPSADEVFFCMTDTDNEVTLMMDEQLIDDGVDGGGEELPHEVQITDERWTPIVVAEGDLGFEQPGIVDGIARPLSSAKIPLLYVSTFATDVFLVEKERLDDARQVLSDEFVFVDAAPTVNSSANADKIQKHFGSDAAPTESSDADRGGETSAAPLPPAGEVTASVTAFNARRHSSPPRRTSDADDNNEGGGDGGRSGAHMVLNKLPWTLRIARVRDFDAIAARVWMRLLLYPPESDRFFSFQRLSYCDPPQISLIVDEAACEQLPPQHVEVAPSEWCSVHMVSMGGGYNAAGIMARFTSPLRRGNISIFKVTTTTNDYSLVRLHELDKTIETLRETHNVKVIEEELG